MNRSNLHKRIGKLETRVADPTTILDVVRAQLDLEGGDPGVSPDDVQELLRRVRVPRMTPELRQLLSEADDAD